MDGKIFDQDIPDEILETIIEKAGGKRFRIPPPVSKHNPLYRKRRNRQICQKRLAGKTLLELVNEFKLTEQRICQILKQNGIHIQEKRRQSLNEEIRMLLSMGCNKAEIARRMGKSRQWVYELIRKENLTKS